MQISLKYIQFDALRKTNILNIIGFCFSWEVICAILFNRGTSSLYLWLRCRGAHRSYTNVSVNICRYDVLIDSKLSGETKFVAKISPDIPVSKWMADFTDMPAYLLAFRSFRTKRWWLATFWESSIDARSLLRVWLQRESHTTNLFAELPRVSVC